MKKVTIAVFGFAVALALTGCKKDYLCHCTGTGYESNSTYQGTSKSNAEDLCDLEQTEAQQGWANVSCTLTEL